MDHASDPVKDIAEIRSIMERSTRILSLSGLAGISIGIVALCGAFFQQSMLLTTPREYLVDYSILLALAVLVLSIVLSIVLSSRMARRQGLPIWNQTAKLLVTELAIPLAAGGATCIALLLHEIYFLLPAMTLTFYGMALVNASTFTVREVRFLGLTEMLLGVLAAVFPEHGLALWAAGFGGVHILYGLRIYMKYEK